MPAAGADVICGDFPIIFYIGVCQIAFGSLLSGITGVTLNMGHADSKTANKTVVVTATAGATPQTLP